MTTRQLDPARFDYLLDRMFHEITNIRRAQEDTRRELHNFMREMHTFNDFVDRYDPRIRDGYLMEQRFREATRSKP